MIQEDKLRAALDAEFPGAEPPPEVWERIREATPALRPEGGGRRRWRRLSLALVWGLITLTAGGVALAEAPQVKAAVDRLLGRTGIKLVEFTPEVQKEWQEKGATVTTAPPEPVAPSEAHQQAPAGMKWPTYLPEPLTGPDVQVHVTSEPTWSMSAWQYGGTSLLLSWHNSVFGPGSQQGTDGPVQETKALKVNGLEANAFRDNSSWTLMWAMDNHQYLIKVRGLPLEEAVKVAESLQ